MTEFETLKFAKNIEFCSKYAKIFRQLGVDFRNQLCLEDELVGLRSARFELMVSVFLRNTLDTKVFLII